MSNVPKTLFSNLADKLVSSLLTAALAAGFGLIAMYFTVSTLSLRVSALEDTAVRKDVITEQLFPMQRDITEMKADIKALLREGIRATNDTNN